MKYDGRKCSYNSKEKVETMLKETICTVVNKTVEERRQRCDSVADNGNR